MSSFCVPPPEGGGVGVRVLVGVGPPGVGVRERVAVGPPGVLVRVAVAPPPVPEDSTVYADGWGLQKCGAASWLARNKTPIRRPLVRAGLNALYGTAYSALEPLNAPESVVTVF